MTIVEEILTQQTQYGIKLTKCLMDTRHGITLNVVLASNTIQPLDEIQANLLEEAQKNRLTSNQMQEAMSNF